MNKKCPMCLENKSLDGFYQSKGKINPYCKECSRKRTKDWYWDRGGRSKTLMRLHKELIDDPELKRKKYREWAWLRKVEVIEHYGGKCVCCGESEIKFLAMDHKNNDGNKHRKLIGNTKIYSWLKKNGYPDNFQILCHNCNMAKAFWKVCPHQIDGATYKLVR